MLVIQGNKTIRSVLSKRLAERMKADGLEKFVSGMTAGQQKACLDVLELEEGPKTAAYRIATGTFPSLTNKLPFLSFP